MAQIIERNIDSAVLSVVSVLYSMAVVLLRRFHS
jgi:hypothetical protein